MLVNCKFLSKCSRQKNFQDTLEKLTHFVVENFNDLFWFLDFINVLFQITLGGGNVFVERMKKFGGGDSGHFLINRRSTTPTHR